VPPTQKEIAKRLGVSQGLVSQILNGKWPARSRLHQHILRECERLGYLPNHAASALRTGRQRTWGVILPSFTWLADFNRQIVQGIWQIAQENSQSLSLMSIEGDEPDASEYMRQIRQGRFDGIFLFYAGKENESTPDIPFEEINQLGVSTVVVNCPMRDGGVHHVYSDAENGVIQVVRHLVEVHNRRRIAYLCRNKHSWLMEDRYRGYVRGHEELGMTVDPALTVDLRSTGSYESDAEALVEELLARGASFDAIVTPMDYVGIPAIGALQDHGIRVPQDVSVTGFDDFHLCAGIRPRLTTVRCDGVEMGRKAAQMMLGVLEEKDNPAIRKFAIPTSLVVRESCGCGRISD